MPNYEVTFTAKIKIKATNAAAAKAALGHEIGGSKLLRLIGSHSGSGSPPSGKTPFGWKWDIRVSDERMTGLKRS